MSLAASDAEEWGGSGEEPEALPPSQPVRPRPDAELIRTPSSSGHRAQRQWRTWASSGRLRKSPPMAFWTSGTCREAVNSPLVNDPPRSCRQFMTSSPRCGTPPIRPGWIPRQQQLSPPLTTPPLEEAVAAHLCPPSALGLKAHVAHPSSPAGPPRRLPTGLMQRPVRPDRRLQWRFSRCFKLNFSAGAWEEEEGFSSRLGRNTPKNCSLSSSIPPSTSEQWSFVSSGSRPAGAVHTRMFYRCDSGPTCNKEQISSSHNHTNASSPPSLSELTFEKIEPLASRFMA